MPILNAAATARNAAMPDPERRVVAVPPDGLDEIEVAVMASEAPAVILLDRISMRLLLRYVRALEQERDEAGSFW